MMKLMFDAPWIMSALIAQSKGGAPQGNFSNFILMLGIIFIAFYFIIIRPQKREQASRKSQLDSLTKGDKVITIGGIHGTVVEVNPTEDSIVLQVDKNTRMTFSRSAVSKVVRKKSTAEPSEEKTTS